MTAGATPILAAALAAFAHSLPAFAEDSIVTPNAACAPFAPWLKARALRPGPSATMNEFTASQEREWRALQASAELLYLAYREGKVSISSIDECLPNEKQRRDFLEVVPTVFFRESLNELDGMGSLKARRFSELARERFGRTGIPMFRLVGHFAEEAPTSSPGGFHRGKGSIFMNFAQIPGEQWLVVFVHELAHALDDVLGEAVVTYGDRDLAKRVAEYGHREGSLENLAPNESVELDRFLLAALDRGLLAEARAWSATMGIYLEGKDQGAWGEIPWLESVYAQRRPDEAVPSLILRTLDPKFEDPSEGIFSLPLVQAGLKDLRSRLSSGRVPLRFGVLGEFLP